MLGFVRVLGEVRIVSEGLGSFVVVVLELFGGDGGAGGDGEGGEAGGGDKEGDEAGAREVQGCEEKELEAVCSGDPLFSQWRPAEMAGDVRHGGGSCSCLRPRGPFHARRQGSHQLRLPHGRPSPAPARPHPN